MAKLGQLLVARGWISVQQLTRALKTQNVAGGRLGTCLLEMDALSEELLLKGLSEHLGVPAAAAEDLRGIPEEVLDLIPDRLARRLHAVPFRMEAGRLDLALMEPRNLSAQDEIAFASGKRVKAYVANEVRIFEALEKYYGEECPSRIAVVLDRLNRARYLWEKTEGRAEPEAAQPPGGSLFATPPRIKLPPPLPEPPPAAAPAPRGTPAAAAAVARAPSPSDTAPVAILRPTKVTLTPEERAELGAVAEVEPAAPPPSPAPTNLDEVEAALAATRTLDEVGEILLGFLCRDHRRAALFQVSRDHISGWKAQGLGVSPNAFTAFSVGFDQPSLFLNLRQSSGLYLGPLPPMPAHRQLARTWGGDLPRDCIMLPVRIKDRLVMVVYADGAAGGPIELPLLQRLLALATAAVERCILQRKRGAPKSR
jgi:hypothetical protein